MNTPTKTRRYKRPDERDPFSDIRNGANATGPRTREILGRKAAFRRVFAKVSSVLGGRTVPVKFGPTKFGTAHTDGISITIDDRAISRAMAEAVDTRDLGSLASTVADMEGMVYHELAHILFTPRHTHRPTKGVMASADPWARMAYNILEDERIEGFFIATYGASKPYFVRMVSKFILEGKDKADASDWLNSAGSWILIHGRRYLPAAIRSAAREAFEIRYSAELADKAATIIDEYRVLVFPRDADRALELVNEFCSVISKVADKAVDEGGGDLIFEDGMDDHENIRTGKADTNAAKDASEKVAEEADAEEASDTDDTDAEDGDTGDATSGAPTDEAGDDLDESASDTDGDGSGDSDDTDAVDGDGSGASGSGETTPDLDEEVRRALENALAEVEDEVLDSARDTIIDANDEYLEATSTDLGKVDEKAFRTEGAEAPSPTLKIAKTNLVRVLEELRGAAAPRWVADEERGELNVPAIFDGRGARTDIFSDWFSNGDDGEDIEVVILLDTSHSMSDLARAAGEGIWMLTKACEYLEIPVTVFGYSTRGRLLSTPDTEVPELIRIPYVGGGTDPREALEGARRVFEVSNARHKLLFSITDGDWFHEDENHKKVDEVNLVDGVRSMLLYFYEHGSWERRSAEEAIAEKRAALAASNYHHHNRGFIGSVADSINVIADEMADALLDEVIR